MAPYLLGFSLTQFLLGGLLFSTSGFLVLLVLLQRGRGGGLAGAFGGSGGQSAFGAKAGDTFTKITVVAAFFWFLLCIATIKLLNQPTQILGSASEPGVSAPDDADDDTETDGDTENAEKEAADTENAALPDGEAPQETSPGSEGSAAPSEDSDGDTAEPSDDSKATP